MEKSGSGLSGIGSIDPQYEHLGWLMTHIRCRESSTNVNITAIGEASASCSLSEVINDTESVEVLDESFPLADNDEVVQILLPGDKDNQGNSKSQVSQPKYAKRKETESRLNWVGYIQLDTN